MRLTQEYVAEMLCVSPRTVQQWEAGTRGMHEGFKVLFDLKTSPENQDNMLLIQRELISNMAIKLECMVEMLNSFTLPR